VIHPTEFDVDHLFGALRGMLRPLLVNESVALVFEEPKASPLSSRTKRRSPRFLRNFISNALKFTERGEIRVSARFDEGDHLVEFSVADTGIGIAPQDQERIFHEFTQIDSPIQRRVQGTGLGLPLCRKLADLLGGACGSRARPGSARPFES
jgi:signal transduction histidine kinase